MKTRDRLETLRGFAFFVAGTDAALFALIALGWLELDTTPRQIGLFAYLTLTLAAIWIPYHQEKRALRREREQAERHAAQWQQVPGKPEGFLQREAVVEFHGLLEEPTPLWNEEFVANTRALNEKIWGPYPGQSQ